MTHLGAIWQENMPLRLEGSSFLDFPNPEVSDSPVPGPDLAQNWPNRGPDVVVPGPDAADIGAQIQLKASPGLRARIWTSTSASGTI